MIYCLYIIIFIQQIQRSLQILHSGFIGEFYIVLWNHGYFGRCHFNSGILQYL